MKRYLVICAVIAVAVIVLFAGQAMAKCADAVYEIRAIVKDEKTGKPVPQARLFVFIDEYRTTLPPRGAPEYFVTDEKGAVSVKAQFDTYSGWLLTDICGKRPSVLMVFVIADGYATNRRVYFVNNLKATTASEPDKYELAFELPAILIGKR